MSKVTNIKKRQWNWEKTNTNDMSKLQFNYETR